MGRIGRYGNHITYRDGYRFDSDCEVTEWINLKLMEQAGQISQLHRPKPVTLLPAFRDRDGTRHEAITWKPDFAYTDKGTLVYLEVKGFETEVWKMKEKMFRSLHPDVPLIVHHVKSGRRS